MDEETQQVASDPTQADPNAANEATQTPSASPDEGMTDEEKQTLQAELDAAQTKLDADVQAEQDAIAQEAAAVRALDVQLNEDPTVHRSFAR